MANIQPICPTDEYAKRGRSWVWLIPPTPPTNLPNDATNKIKVVWARMFLYIKIVIGAIFCHVDRSIHNGHEILLITKGNQKWHGAAPILINNAVKIRKPLIFSLFTIDESENIINLLNAPNKRIPEPIACAKKYLTAASVSRIIDDLVTNGINERRFSSKPIQI